MKITINTNCHAPCCPCEILASDGRSILVQTDWDYPGFASSFGWSVQRVQKCRACGKVHVIAPLDNGAIPEFFTCDEFPAAQPCCHHNGTDGTVTCKGCSLVAGDFIAAAGDFLRDNDKLIVDDPGYFDGE